MADTPADPYACNSTAQLLASLEKGDFDALVFADLRDLIAAMRDHAADAGPKNKVKGKLTLTLDLTLLGDAFTVVSDHKITKPKAPASVTTLFATDKNTLSRQSMRKLDMFLTEADIPPTVSKFV